MRSQAKKVQFHNVLKVIFFHALILYLSALFFFSPGINEKSNYTNIYKVNTLLNLCVCALFSLWMNSLWVSGRKFTRFCIWAYFCINIHKAMNFPVWFSGGGHTFGSGTEEAHINTAWFTLVNRWHRTQCLEKMCGLFTLTLCVTCVSVCLELHENETENIIA